MFKTLKNNHGFSLVEMILALAMGAMVVGVTAETLVNNVDSYTFIASRKSALGDVRAAMGRISYDLLRVSSSDISNIYDTRINFTDSTGAATNFRIDASAGGFLALYRGNDILVDKVSAFTLTYYDVNGAVLAATAANKNSVRRIKYTMTTDPVAGEGALTLSTVVTPREFIGYSNYQ